MDVLRSVGRLERYSTSRHALGFYRAVVVTCRYKLTTRGKHRRVEDLVFLALPHVIARHASLCCTIADEATENPVFVRLESINLKDIVTFTTLLDEDSLAHHLEQLHNQLWTHLERRPPWKLVVFQRPTTEDDIIIDVAFAFHHAIADGLSGAAFHKSFLRELRKVTGEDDGTALVSDVVEIPRGIKLPAPMEDLIKFPLSWGFLAGQVLREYGPGWLFRSPGTLWSGASCASLETVPYSPRIRIVSIPAHKVDTILKAARAEKVTLTSFVTGVLVVALASLLPEAERFLGVTPYSMRRLIGTSNDEIVNSVSSFDKTYDKALLDVIRASSDGTARVWKVAHHFQNDLEAELRRCPRDVSVGLLPYVSNYRDFHLKKINQPRGVTFEISNLGLFSPLYSEDSQVSDVSSWVIDSILFTQGPTVIGAAINVNCASVRGGPLNISVTWQDGIVNESVINGVVRAFEGLATETQE